MKTPLKGIEIKNSTQKRETATQPTVIDMQQNLQYLFNQTPMQCRCTVQIHQQNNMTEKLGHECKLSYHTLNRLLKNLRAQYIPMKRGGNLLVSISETTKLLLSSSIPAVEANLSTVCEEIQWMHFHTNSSCLKSNQIN